MRLAGKVALVTGASGGMGRCEAELFAREGARIAGCDVAKPPEEAWAQLRKAAPEASFTAMDVRDEGAVAKAVAAAAARFGRIDVLVNAAGVSGAGSVDSGYVRAFSEWVRAAVQAGDLERLKQVLVEAPHAERSHPTPEHLWPLLIAAGASGNAATATFIEGDVTHGVLAMDSVLFGRADETGLSAEP